MTIQELLTKAQEIEDEGYSGVVQRVKSQLDLHLKSVSLPGPTGGIYWLKTGILSPWTIQPERDAEVVA